MEAVLLWILNGLGVLFIIYTIVQGIRVQLTIKRCEPIHKRPLRAKPLDKNKTNFWVFIIVAIVLWGGCLLGIAYFKLIQIMPIYFAAITALSSFATLFRQGKIGEKGIAVTDKFIRWEDVHSYTLDWFPITSSQYPNGRLIINTLSGQQYELIVEKEYKKEIGNLLESKSPA
ncbi:hypothetical protein DCC39_11830 [Pueribacillus theae]|uniref:DUF5673 domain-containing protein n=1 Tax=Pueribacillus theae TaxID=2171751 RepID=A0A2U1JXY1_9BACI|nr:DUF5673 domain-containing protein [Pueribacillus theae]PWA10076.1 hypothetical protein DCC39_11830 [Pueribacillus theae]